MGHLHEIEFSQKPTYVGHCARITYPTPSMVLTRRGDVTGPWGLPSFFHLWY